MNRLPDWLREKLASPPSAGDGIHGWLFSVARQLHAHMDAAAIEAALTDATAGCSRRVTAREIRDAVQAGAVGSFLFRFMTEIFNHGGGTQSAAITALIVRGEIEKPDYVCIVDTERERSTTWEYLDNVIRPALKKVGLEVHRIRKSFWGSKPPHGKDWLSHNGKTVLLPGFTSQNGGNGKLSGFCSGTWKVETQERYVRNVLGVKTKFQRNWIGFSTDEMRRAVRMMGGEDYKAGRIYFPLIEGVRLRRQAAIREVLKMGWPIPPRSRCWNCPNQQDDEWQECKLNAPEEFALACEMEREIQKDDPFFWLHSSCVPLSEVDFTKPAQPHDDLFSTRSCASGGCFT